MDRNLEFRGMADENGNLYWFEVSRDVEATYLVSVTADGTQRFRKPILEKLDWVWEAALGNGVLFVGAHASATAYDAADGHVLWTRSVANDVTNTIDRYVVNSIAVAPDGNPVFSFGSMGRASESVAYSWAIALDGATGATRWKQQVSALSLAADSEGNAYIRNHDRGITSVDSAGKLRWTNVSLLGATSDLAVWNGVAVGDSVIDTADGTVAGTFAIGSDAISDFALMGPTQAFLAYTDFSGFPGKGLLAPIRTSPTDLDSPLTARDSLRYPTSHATLMTGARVVVTRGQPDPAYKIGTTLTVYAPGGASTCELQGGTWSGLSPVVQQGRLITTVDVPSAAGGWNTSVVAFDAPGFAPEAKGWITHRGSFARNGRAR